MSLSFLVNQLRSDNHQKQSSHARPWRCQSSIRSKPAAARQWVDEVVSRLKRLTWKGSQLFHVQLALEEALANAISHGNRDDKTKVVQVVYELSQCRARFEISDQGAGFTPADVPDPTQADTVLQAGGRGIFLMRSYMDRVEFNDAGNQVVMEKRRDR